jgi:hypothetical protein
LPIFDGVGSLDYFSERFIPGNLYVPGGAF